jgi:hypothetical protein
MNLAAEPVSDGDLPTIAGPQEVTRHERDGSSGLQTPRPFQAKNASTCGIKDVPQTEWFRSTACGRLGSAGERRARQRDMDSTSGSNRLRIALDRVFGDKPAVTEKRIDPLEAITRHLNKTDDPTLLVLRTHLMVEERLRDMIGRACNAPGELRAARLTFYQVLCICRALVGRHDEAPWVFVERLNEVRNRMAHHLAPGDLDELVGSVVKKLDRLIDRRPATAVERFRSAAVYVVTYFDAIKWSARWTEAYGPEVTLPLRRRRRRRKR